MRHANEKKKKKERKRERMEEIGVLNSEIISTPEEK